MGMPTAEELHEALDEAARMREKDEDAHHIAKSLLNLHYRMKYMERVLKAAELYMHGQGIQEHRELLKAIEAIRAIEDVTKGEDHSSFV